MTVDALKDLLYSQILLYYQSKWCGIKCNTNIFLNNSKELSRIIFLKNNVVTCKNDSEINCLINNINEKINSFK